ncbi:MAG: enoyl-CoA hydratase/isomerase family protein [Hyphomicrobiaceae bacterium]
MPWTIESKGDHVAVVTMNTNNVNAQNPAFFTDLHAAFDRLETEFSDCAVVLTGTGKVFSAGLDLDHHFAMFARQDIDEIDRWFAAYRATNLRIFTYPHPTVAAINGHAYAGGFITAIDCDYRIAAQGVLQFALNEVPIGIPMPAVYCGILKYTIGTKAAAEFTLFGQVCDLATAHREGVVQKTGDQMGRTGAAGLLHSLRVLEACATGDNHGCNRRGSTPRSGFPAAWHVGPDESPCQRAAVPGNERSGLILDDACSVARSKEITAWKRWHATYGMRAALGTRSKLPGMIFPRPPTTHIASSKRYAS